MNVYYEVGMFAEDVNYVDMAAFDTREEAEAYIARVPKRDGETYVINEVECDTVGLTE